MTDLGLAFRRFANLFDLPRDPRPQDVTPSRTPVARAQAQQAKTPATEPERNRRRSTGGAVSRSGDMSLAAQATSRRLSRQVGVGARRADANEAAAPQDDGARARVTIDPAKAYATGDPALDAFTQAAKAAGYSQAEIDLAVAQMRAAGVDLWRNEATKQPVPKSYAEYKKQGLNNTYMLSTQALDDARRALSLGYPSLDAYYARPTRDPAARMDPLMRDQVLSLTTKDKTIAADDPLLRDVPDEGLRKIYARLSNVTAAARRISGGEENPDLDRYFSEQVEKLKKDCANSPIGKDVDYVCDWLQEQVNGARSPIQKAAAPSTAIGTLNAITSGKGALVEEGRVDALAGEVEGKLRRQGVPEENVTATGDVYRSLAAMRKAEGTSAFDEKRAAFDQAIANPAFRAVASKEEIDFYKKTADAFAAESKNRIDDLARKPVSWESPRRPDPTTLPPNPADCKMLATGHVYNATLGPVTGAMLEVNGKRYFSAGVTVPGVGVDGEAIAIWGPPGVKAEDVILGPSLSVQGGVKLGGAPIVGSVSANSSGYVTGIGAGLSVGSPIGASFTDTVKSGQIPVIQDFNPESVRRDVTAGLKIATGFSVRSPKKMREDIADRPLETNGQARGLYDHLFKNGPRSFQRLLPSEMEKAWVASPEYARLEKLIAENGGVDALDRDFTWTKLGPAMREAALTFYDRELEKFLR